MLNLEPDGTVYEVFNLDKFCKESNLDINYFGLIKLCSGKNNFYKGWKIMKVVK